MKSLLYIILILLLFSFSKEGCFPGENCPYNQGECSDDQCICKDGYFTIIDPEKDDIDQVFCDYEQISVKLMLLFEVIIPGSGQLYAQRWIHGIIKLALFIAFIVVSCTVEKRLLIPKLFIYAKKALLGGGDGDDDKKKEGKEDGQNQENENEKPKSWVRDFLSFEDADPSKLGFGGTKEFKEKMAKFCSWFAKVVIYIFWFVYSVDIYLIFFRLYPDGKGISFGE